MSQANLSPQLNKLKQTLSSQHHPSDNNTAEAGIGILLLETNSRLETLLIQRPERPGDPWSGHVSFPGGRTQPSDNSVRDAARREVMEEVGIDLSQDAEELGTLTIGIPGRPPEIRVQPWVFALKKRPPLKTNSEVVEAFWAVLADLPSKLTTAEMVIRGEPRKFPCYLVDGHIVWGFTFKVLNELLQILQLTAKP